MNFRVFSFFLRRILHFFCEFLMKFCPDFATNSREEWRVSLFQSNLRNKLENCRKFWKLWKLFIIIHYYSLWFIIIHSCPYSSCGVSAAAVLQSTMPTLIARIPIYMPICPEIDESRRWDGQNVHENSKLPRNRQDCKNKKAATDKIPEGMRPVRNNQLCSIHYKKM